MDSLEVRLALQSSRYNETVVVNIEEDGSQQKEVLLIPCLDEENGGIIWNQYNGEEDDNNHLDSGIVRHLRTKRWFFPMLNDARRNELYEAAIQRASQEVVERLKEQQSDDGEVKSPIRVLDIGSGTGLLAMMAVKFVEQALKDDKMGGQGSPKYEPTVHATSLEMSSAMSRLARLTVFDNDMQDKITVLEKHSTDDLSDDLGGQRVSFCVSELLESSLLAEGILPALRDAWERHLHHDAVIVPQQARVYCQIVEGSSLHSYWGPHTSNSAGDSNVRLCLSASQEDLMLDGGARGGFILPIHAEHWLDDSPNTEASKQSTRRQDSNLKLKPLSDPVEVMDFDFSAPGKLPGPKGRTRATQIVPHTSGTVHAVLFWWELDLWKDITYSTQVGKENWQDHWHQCLFVFTAKDRAAANDEKDRPQQYGYQVHAGKECQLMTSHCDTAIWFSMGQTKENVDDKHPSKRIKLQSHESDEREDAHSAIIHEQTPPTEQMLDASKGAISPLRAWQLNDNERRLFLRRGIQAALKQKGKDAVVFDVSDFSLCAILSALEGASRVSSLESSSGQIPSLSARVAQLANNLPRKKLENPQESALFQVIQCHAEQVSLKLLNGTDDDSKLHPVDVIVAEPYYEMLEGWHLQEALNYFYLTRALRKRGILSKSAVAVPSLAILKGCAIQSFQLKNAYGSCGTATEKMESASICGFDHTRTNQHGSRFDRFDLTLPAGLWCDYVELTESFEIARLCYYSSSTQTSTSVRIPFQQTGTCHGILVWVDYANAPVKGEEQPSTTQSATLVDSHSTLGRSYHQLVRMLPTPFVLDTNSLEEYEFVCHFEVGNQKDLESYKLDLQVQPRNN